MKKLLQGILITSLFISILNVNAGTVDDTFFTNKNNVAFTRFQYDTTVDSIGLKGVLNMTSEEYEKMNVGLLSKEDTEVKVLEDYDVVDENENLGISTLAESYHETTYKKLTGITTCVKDKKYCQLNIFLDWKLSPSTRSHDVIGARLQSTTFYDDAIETLVSSDNNFQSVAAQRKETKGRATVIKLPASGNLNYVSFTTRTNKGGVVQVSYQHSQGVIAKYDALDFKFSAGGLGGVFEYEQIIANYYDHMAGLSLANS